MHAYFRFSTLAVLACAALLPAPGARAQDAAQSLLDEAVVAISAQRGLDAGPVVLERAPRVRREIGAVIDGMPMDGGLPRVLAITPRRAAERIGIRAGDRVRAINGIQLETAADPGGAIREALESSPGSLHLELQRGEEVVEVSGVPDRVEIPGYRLQIDPLPQPEGCGRLSTFLKPPPSSGLFPLLLHEVDGRLAGSLDSEVVRVDAGLRRLKLSERIADVRFQTRQNYRREQLNRNEMFKYLEIDVQPDTKYHLAARFHPERREPISEQAYWEPVVWKETRETCR